MIVLALVSLAVAIACYSISQLILHGKFKFENSFSDGSSWKRKYKIKWMLSREGSLPDFGQFIPAPQTWYYKFFKIKYKERFPLSSTMLVFLTDGYHFLQFFFFLFLSLSVAFALYLTWWWFAVWIGIHVVHTLTYKLLSR